MVAGVVVDCGDVVVVVVVVVAVVIDGVGGESVVLGAGMIFRYIMFFRADPSIRTRLPSKLDPCIQDFTLRS